MIYIFFSGESRPADANGGLEKGCGSILFRRGLGGIFPQQAGICTHIPLLASNEKPQFKSFI